MTVACALAHRRTHTYADAPTRGVRVWSNIHPFTTTNKMPIIQAAHAAELSAAKPRTQGEMNNKTPRTTERYSGIQAALTKASATSARITPSTRETQFCQCVHAFIATTSFLLCNRAEFCEKHGGGHYLGLR